MYGLRESSTIAATIASLYSRVIILTIFIYNYVLSIADEITYIWLKPFSFGSLFYIIGRYLALGSLIFTYSRIGFLSLVSPFCYEEVEFPGTCRDLANPLILNDFYVQGKHFPYTGLLYTGAIDATCAMILIQMRTYVLYEKNKMTMILFSALNAIALVFFVVEVTVLSLPKYVNNIETLTAASEIGLHFTYYSPLFWAPFLLNEVVTFLMVFFKFIKVRWSSKGTISSGSNMTLYNVVIRDNMIYFFVIFLVYLSGFVLFINPGIQQTFDGTHMLASIAVSGILAPNLLLMLKKGYYKQEQDAKPATGISTFHATVCHGIETHIADQDG